jgi:hypothetical protein
MRDSVASVGNSHSPTPQPYARNDEKRVAEHMIGRHVAYDMSLAATLDAAANAGQDATYSG